MREKTLKCTFCPLLCIIITFNLFFCSVYLFSPVAYASDDIVKDFFWRQLESSLDRQIQAIEFKNSIIVPSDDFNDAVKKLSDERFPFGATPHFPNQYGSWTFTPSSTPKAYIVFSYDDTQSSIPSISFSNPVFIFGSDWYSSTLFGAFNDDGYSSNLTHKDLPSGYWAYVKTDAKYCAPRYFKTSSDALINSKDYSGQLPYGLCAVPSGNFGIYECPCDDNTVFSPPSLVPSGADVYIPRGSLTVSGVAYKLDGQFYDIAGDPIDDPTGSGGGGSSSGDIIVGGHIDVSGSVGVDVTVSVPDINININGNGDGIGEDLGDYIDTSGATTDLGDVISNIPQLSKGFTDYLKDFFAWLPPEIYGLIIAILVVTLWRTIIRR